MVRVERMSFEQTEGMMVMRRDCLFVLVGMRGGEYGRRASRWSREREREVQSCRGKRERDPSNLDPSRKPSPLDACEHSSAHVRVEIGYSCTDDRPASAGNEVLEPAAGGPEL
jgi:hypothetical protein